MSSSTLLGDRRWASSRKGMTVLGKVPKPINLPSQRLENHGLDPNVEIVPKGTLTWGSRPSAPTNVWASSSHSPSSADGSIGSPNRQNGRPSSGGTGTRPSTAGSDRCSEPAANSWTSSSRPSSASGILASSQSPLAATRPRSAETRPGSSQLSRFAEPIPENSVPWSAGSAGRLGTTSKTSNFMLSSGDFPTLGSAKNSEVGRNEQGTHDHDPHGQSLSSGLASGEKERSSRGMSMEVQLERDNSNAWKVDAHSHTPLSNTNSWHIDPSNKLPPGTSMQPQHYNWHGPPQSPSDGIWYRGVPPGPYGSGDAPPRNMSDPFAYYSSQQVPGPANNNNSSPQPGALLGGYPHKREQPFRPSASSDPYMIPTISVVPIRPEMYPNPLPCDGYYAPPRAGFSGSNERERPVIGMTAGPVIHNQFSSQNVAGDKGKTGNCTGSPTPMRGPQLEGSHCRDSHGEKYRVLLKHREEFSDNGTRNNKGHLAASSSNTSMKKEPDVLEGEWETDGSGAELVKTTQDAVHLAAPCNDISTDPTQVSCSKDMPGPDKVQRVCDNQVMTSESMMPQSNVQHILKKSTLLEKIEGLNNKVRVTDRHSEAAISSNEERPRRVKPENVKVGNSTKTMLSSPSSTSKGPSENVHIGPKPMLLDDQENALKKRSYGYAGKVKVVSQESTITAASVPGNSDLHLNIQAEQVRGHASHGGDHYSKSRINGSEVRRLPVPRNESLGINVMGRVDKTSDVDPQSEVPDPSKKHYVSKVREEAPPVDPTEYDVQREKMKEMAAQRAKQLQKEEEERRREQKAKALAKLEELDRRAVASTTALKINPTCVQSTALSHKQDAVVAKDQNIDVIGRASTETTASGSISAVNDGILCSVGDNLLQNKKPACLGAQPLVSVKKSEGAVTMQKVDFASSSQISFGTVQTCDSSMKQVCGLPGVQKCASAIDQSKGTDIALLDSQTSQFISETSQESRISGKVGNEMSYKSNDCPPDDSAKHRHIGHRRRNAIPRERNSIETPNPSDSASPNSPRVLPAGNLSSGGGVFHDSVEVVGPSVQHKKGTRIIKPKSRPQQGASISMEEYQGRSEGILEKPPESCKFEASFQIESFSSAQRQTGEDNTGGQDSSEDIARTNSGQSELREELQAKTIGQRKPHTPRRSIKNGQSKSSEKSRGSEVVVWTPVRLPSKGEPGEEERNCQDQDHPPLKIGTDSQNVKHKRADIERYIPKSVAKGASQQRNSQKTLPFVITKNENSSNEVETGKGTCKDDAQLPKSDISVVIKSAEINRPSKHGKGHASWRQRTLPEGFSDAMKPVSKLPDQSFPSNMNDANDSCNSHPSEPAVTMVKNQIMGSRGKQRQVHRVQKISEENPPIMDSTVSPNGASDNPTPASLDASDGNGKSLFRADTVQVERTRPHWKPKSNQTSGSVTKHQENSNHEISHNAKLKESEGKHAVHEGADSMENGNFEEHDLSSDALAGLVGQSSGKTDPKLGLHRQGWHDGHLRKVQDSGRLHRGHEAHHGGRHDNGYWNGAVTGDRRRQSYHYEYQRVESHNKSNDQHANAPTDSLQHGYSRPAGPRYRDRGHARRGGQFYARNGGGGTQ